MLRDIEELSTEETAETLGISVPAVKSRLLRARLALREKLTRQFKRKGENFLVTCKQFLQELNDYLDGDGRPGDEETLAGPRGCMPQLLRHRRYHQEDVAGLQGHGAADSPGGRKDATLASPGEENGSQETASSLTPSFL